MEIVRTAATVSWEQAVDFAARAFAATGVPEDQARKAAEALVDADLHGTVTHGLKNLRRYVEQLLSADINFDGPISLKKLTRQATRALERKIILKVLHNHHWNRKQAARTLNISYRALLYKIRDAGLPPNRVRRTPEPATGTTQVAAD